MLFSKVVVDKVLPPNIESTILSWSPTMDLLAIFSTNGILWIYRGTTGQRVWSFPLKSSVASIATVSNVCIEWSSDAQMLLVCGDGISGFKIYDIVQGKLIVDVKNQEIMNFDKLKNNRKLQTIKWVSMNYKEISKTKTAVQDNLMEDLLSYNVLDSMPKLAPLPTSNASHVLSSKFAMDGMISDFESIIHNVLIMAKDNNTIDVVFNSFFDITDVVCKPEDCGIQWLKIHDMGNYQYSLISVLKKNNNDQRELVSINLSLPISDDEFVENVISCSTQIGLNFLYLYEVINNLQNECKVFIEFNNKMLSLFDTALDESSTERFSSICSQLYELLLTGMMSNNLKYWVENHLGDKNIKKWSKIGNTCFDQLKHKILTLFIPSAQRCVILFSRLRSLIIWRSKQKKDLLTMDIKNINDYIMEFKEITSMVYTFAVNSNYEQKLFNCFNNWLTDTLERIKDEDSKKSNNMYYNISDISEYITKNLNTNLRVLDFLYQDENLKSQVNTIKDNFEEMTKKLKLKIRSKIIFGEPTPINIRYNDIRIFSSQKIDDKILYASYNSDRTIIVTNNTGNLYKAFDLKRLLRKYNSSIMGIEIINEEEIIVVARISSNNESEYKSTKNLKECDFFIIIKLNIYMDDSDFHDDTNPNKFCKFENHNICPENIKYNARTNNIAILSSKKYIVLSN